MEKKRRQDRHGAQRRESLLRSRTQATRPGKAAAGAAINGRNTRQTEVWSNALGLCTNKIFATTRTPAREQESVTAMLKRLGRRRTCTKEQVLKRRRYACGKKQQMMIDILDKAPQGEFLARIVYLIFSQLVVPLLREHFYITEAEPSFNRSRFFRKIAWLHIETYAGRSFSTRSKRLYTNLPEEQQCHSSCKWQHSSTDRSSSRNSPDTSGRNRTCPSSCSRSHNYTSSATENTSCGCTQKRQRTGNTEESDMKSVWHLDCRRRAKITGICSRRSTTGKSSSSSKLYPDTRISLHSGESCVSSRAEGQDFSMSCKRRHACDSNPVCGSSYPNQKSSTSLSTFSATGSDSSVVNMTVCKCPRRDYSRSKRIIRGPSNSSYAVRVGSGRSRDCKESTGDQACLCSPRRGRVRHCEFGGSVTSRNNGPRTIIRGAGNRTLRGIQSSRNRNICDNACATQLSINSKSSTSNTGSSVNRASMITKQGVDRLCCSITGKRSNNPRWVHDASSTCLVALAHEERKEKSPRKHTRAALCSRGFSACRETVAGGGANRRKIGVATGSVRIAEELELEGTSDKKIILASNFRIPHSFPLTCDPVISSSDDLAAIVRRAARLTSIPLVRFVPKMHACRPLVNLSLPRSGLLLAHLLHASLPPLQRHRTCLSPSMTQQLNWHPQQQICSMREPWPQHCGSLQEEQQQGCSKRSQQHLQMQHLEKEKAKHRPRQQHMELQPYASQKKMRSLHSSAETREQPQPGSVAAYLSSAATEKRRAPHAVGSDPAERQRQWQSQRRQQRHLQREGGGDNLQKTQGRGEVQPERDATKADQEPAAPVTGSQQHLWKTWKLHKATPQPAHSNQSLQNQFQRPLQLQNKGCRYVQLHHGCISVRRHHLSEDMQDKTERWQQHCPMHEYTNNPPFTITYRDFLRSQLLAFYMASRTNQTRNISNSGPQLGGNQLSRTFLHEEQHSKTKQQELSALGKTAKGALRGPRSASGGAPFPASARPLHLAESVHSNVTGSSAACRHSSAAQLSINSLTRPLCCCLAAAARLHPRLLQCSVLSLSDIQRRLRCWWKHTRRQLLRAQHILQQLGPAAGVAEASISSTCFFVVGDLQNCFESLQHDAVLQAVAAAMHLVNGVVDPSKPDPVAAGTGLRERSNNSTDPNQMKKYTRSGTLSRQRNIRKLQRKVRSSNEDKVSKKDVSGKAANKWRGGKADAQVTRARRKEATTMSAQDETALGKRGKPKLEFTRAAAGSVMGDSGALQSPCAPSAVAIAAASALEKNSQSKTSTCGATTETLALTEKYAVPRAELDEKTMGNTGSKRPISSFKKKESNGLGRTKNTRARNIPKKLSNRHECQLQEEGMRSAMLVMQIYRRIIPPLPVAAAAAKREARPKMAGSSFSLTSQPFLQLRKQMHEEQRQEDKHEHQKQEWQGQRYGRALALSAEGEVQQQSRLHFTWLRSSVLTQLLQRTRALTDGHAVDCWTSGPSALTGYLEEIAIPAESLLSVDCRGFFTEQMTPLSNKPSTATGCLFVRPKRNFARANNAAAVQRDAHELRKSTTRLSATQPCAKAAGHAKSGGASVPAPGRRNMLLEEERALPEMNTPIAASVETEKTGRDSLSSKSPNFFFPVLPRSTILEKPFDTVSEYLSQGMDKSAADANPVRLPISCFSSHRFLEIAGAISSTPSYAAAPSVPAPLYDPPASQSSSLHESTADRQSARSLSVNAREPMSADRHGEIQTFAAAAYRREVLVAAAPATAATHTTCASRPSLRWATTGNAAAGPSLEVAVAESSVTPLSSRGTAHSDLIKPIAETTVPKSAVTSRRQAHRLRLPLWSMLRKRLLRGCCERGCVLVSATPKPLIHVTSADVVTGTRLLLQQQYVKLPRGIHTVSTPVKGKHLSSSFNVASCDRRSTVSSNGSRRINSTECNRRDNDSTYRSQTSADSSVKTKKLVLRSSRNKKSRDSRCVNKACRLHTDNSRIPSNTGEDASGDTGSRNTNYSPHCSSSILNSESFSNGGRASRDSTRSSNVSPHENSSSRFVDPGAFTLDFMCNSTSHKLFRQHIGLPQGSNLSAVVCALYYAQRDGLPQVQALLNGSTAHRAAVGGNASVALATEATSKTAEITTVRSNIAGGAAAAQELSPKSQVPRRAAPEKFLAMTCTPVARASLPSTTAIAAEKGVVEEVPKGHAALWLGPKRTAARKKPAATAVQRKNAAAGSSPPVVRAGPLASAGSRQAVTVTLREGPPLRCQQEHRKEIGAVLSRSDSEAAGQQIKPLQRLHHTNRSNRKELVKESPSAEKPESLLFQNSVRIGPLLLHFIPAPSEDSLESDERKTVNYSRSDFLMECSKNKDRTKVYLRSTSDGDGVPPRCSASLSSENWEGRLDSDGGQSRRERSFREECTKNRELRCGVVGSRGGTGNTYQSLPEQQGHVSLKSQDNLLPRPDHGDPQSHLSISAVPQHDGARHLFRNTASEPPLDKRGAASASATLETFGKNAFSSVHPHVAVDVANPSSCNRTASASSPPGPSRNAGYSPPALTDGVDSLSAHLMSAKRAPGRTAVTNGTCAHRLRNSRTTAPLIPLSFSSNRLILQHETAPAGRHVKDQTTTAHPECSAETAASRSVGRFSASKGRRRPSCTGVASPNATGGSEYEFPPRLIAPDRPSASCVLPPVCSVFSGTIPNPSSAPASLTSSPATAANGSGTKTCDAWSPGAENSFFTRAAVDACVTAFPAASASGTPPLRVRSLVSVISASAHPDEDTMPRAKSTSRKNARRQLLRRLSRLRWRPLLMRWVDDFLFISPVLWQAKTFLRLLLQEKVWGPNVNQNKLQMNFDAADDVAGERPSCSRKNRIIVYSHGAHCSGSNVEQQHSLPLKIKRRINTLEYANSHPQTSTGKGNTPAHNRHVWTPAKEMNANGTFISRCQRPNPPSRPTQKTLNCNKRTRCSSATNRDIDCGSTRKRRDISSAQVQQSRSCAGRQLRAYSAVGETQGMQDQNLEDPTPGRERRSNPTSRVVSRDQGLLQTSATQFSLYAKALELDQVDFSRSRTACSTCSRACQEVNFGTEESTVFGLLCCSRGSREIDATSVKRRAVCRKVTGLRLDMRVFQQEGVWISPLITRNSARFQQRRSRGTAIGNENSKRRRTAENSTGQAFSAFVCCRSYHSLRGTGSETERARSRIGGAHVLLEHSNERPYAKHGRKRKQGERSRGNEGTRKRIDTGSSRTVQILAKQTEDLASKFQSTIKDAVVLQCFRTKRREFCGAFMQVLLEQRLFGHLKARAGSTGIFFDTVLNSRFSLLRNMYIVYKNVLLRTRCAVTRISKEFAGFIQPFYLIGLCMRLLMYLFSNVRCRISSASLRCRRPLLAALSNAIAKSHTGCAGRCCCTAIAARRKHATSAVAISEIKRASASLFRPFPAHNIIDGSSGPLRKSVLDQLVYQSSSEPSAGCGSGTQASAALGLDTPSPLDSRTRSPRSCFTFSPSPKVESAAVVSTRCNCCYSSSSCSPQTPRPDQVCRADAEEAASDRGETITKGVAREAAAARTADEVNQIARRTTAMTMVKTSSVHVPKALKYTRVTLNAENESTAPGEEAATATETGKTCNKRTVALDSRYLKEFSGISMKSTASADISMEKKLTIASASPPGVLKPIQPQAHECAFFFWQQARLLCFNAIVSVFSARNATRARHQVTFVRSTISSPARMQSRRRQLSWKRAAKTRISRLHKARRKRREQREKRHGRRQQQQQRQQPMCDFRDVRDQAALRPPERARCIPKDSEHAGREENVRRAAATALVRDSTAVDASTQGTLLQIPAVATDDPSCATGLFHTLPGTVILGGKEAAPANAYTEEKYSKTRQRGAHVNHSEQRQAGESHTQQRMTPHQNKGPPYDLLVQGREDSQYEGQQSTVLIACEAEKKLCCHTLQLGHYQQQSRVVVDLPGNANLAGKRATKLRSTGTQSEHQHNVEDWNIPNTLLKKHTTREWRHIRQTQVHRGLWKLCQHNANRREEGRPMRHASRGQEKQLKSNLRRQILRQVPRNEHLRCRVTHKRRVKKRERKPPPTKASRAAKRRMHAFACCSSYFARLALHPQLLRTPRGRRIQFKHVSSEIHRRMPERQNMELRLGQHSRMHTPTLHHRQQRQQMLRERRLKMPHKRKRSYSADEVDCAEVQPAELESLHCSAEGGGTSDTHPHSRKVPAGRGITAQRDSTPPVLQRARAISDSATADASFSSVSAGSRITASPRANDSRRDLYPSCTVCNPHIIKEHQTSKRLVKRRLDEKSEHRIPREGRGDAEGKCDNDVPGVAAPRPPAEEDIASCLQNTRRGDKGSSNTSVKQPCEDGQNSKDVHVENTSDSGEERKRCHSPAPETGDVQTRRDPTLHPHLHSVVDGAETADSKILMEQTLSGRTKRKTVDESICATVDGNSEETAGKSEENAEMQPLRLTAERDARRIQLHAQRNEEMKTGRQDAFNDVIAEAGNSQLSTDEAKTEFLRKEPRNVDGDRSTRHVATKQSACLPEDDVEQDDSGRAKLRKLHNCSANQIVDVARREGCQPGTAGVRLSGEGQNSTVAISYGKHNGKRTKPARNDDGGYSREGEKTKPHTGAVARTRPYPKCFEQWTNGGDGKAHAAVGQVVRRQKGVCALAYTVREGDGEDCLSMVGIEEEKRRGNIHRAQQEVKRNIDGNRVLVEHAVHCCKQGGAAEEKYAGSKARMDKLSPSVYDNSQETIFSPPEERKLWTRMLQHAATRALAFSQFIEESELRQGEGWPPLTRARKSIAQTKRDARSLGFRQVFR